MNTYTGLHARYYDVVYADKPYAEEARFVDALLHRQGVATGTLLDLACGSGRHAAELSALGWEVTGLDYSKALLERARQNAPSARFLVGDMRQLDLPGQSFDAITCLFDSIGYALDDEAIVATLRGAARHLKGDGALVLEFLHAPALLRDASPIRVRSYVLPCEGDELVRISRTRLDEQRNIMNVEFELLELRANATYDRWLESQANRFFSVGEMETLLEHAGLEVQRFEPAYGDGATIDDATFHVLAVARTHQ